MTGKSEITKIMIVVVILLLLLTGIFFIRNKQSVPSNVQESTEEESAAEETGVQEQDKTAKEPENLIILEIDNETVTAGDSAAVNLKFKAPGKNIFGSDVYLMYDPDYLQVNENGIGKSDYFVSMPRATTDIENGIIKVTAFDGADKVLDSEFQNLFKVEFRALKTGTTTVSLNFSKGTTNTTTLVERETSRNVLEGVSGLTIVIK